MTINNGLFTSNSGDWTTPKWLFNWLDSDYHFTYDLSATKENTLCDKYYSKENSIENAIGELRNEYCFMNPPYGHEINFFIKSSYYIAKQNNTTVNLLPTRTDTRWFYDYCRRASIIIFLKGRLKFGNINNSAPFPSCIVVFDLINHDPSIYWVDTKEIKEKYL